MHCSELTGGMTAAYKLNRARRFKKPMSKPVDTNLMVWQIGQSSSTRTVGKDQ